MARLKQEQDLFESERSFRLLVEGVADYALYMLDPDGHCDQLEYRRAAHQGLPAARRSSGSIFRGFTPPPTRPTASPRGRSASPREQGRYEEEGWRVRKDGSFFWASVVIDPIRRDGRLIGFAKITRDITERREAALNLERMQKQLAESQKLDALGQLTGGVAHDFNNLLMVDRRQRPGFEEICRRREIPARHRSYRVGRKAGRCPDQPAPDLRPATERQSADHPLAANASTPCVTFSGRAWAATFNSSPTSKMTCGRSRSTSPNSKPL